MSQVCYENIPTNANEIQNFARELCASGNSEACVANEKINEMTIRGEFARLARSISRPVY